MNKRIFTAVFFALAWSLSASAGALYSEDNRLSASQNSTGYYDVVAPIFNSDPVSTERVAGMIYYSIASSAFKGVDNAGSLITITAPTYIAPSVQRFTTGSGTYTTPTNPSPLYLKVTIVGGGGGGGGGGGASPGSTGGTGGTTSFGTSLLTAVGGIGGEKGDNAYGAGRASTGGGTVTVNSPAVSVSALVGGGETSGASSAANQSSGGNGNTNPLGGSGGGATNNNTGIAGITNTGAGGGGGGSGSAGGFGGGGGAAGGYLQAIISSPGASYSYAVGAAGTAGTAASNTTNGYPGGAGGSGIVVIEEFYQ